MLNRDKNEMVVRARSLRREMTLPETLLWRELRSRPAGFKFRRQHPIGSLVVDFYCAATRLVIEIDGQVHEMGDNPRRDGERDSWLRTEAFRVLRIPARDVMRELNSVLELILAECRQ